MKIKNIKSFVDFYKFMGVTVTIDREKRINQKSTNPISVNKNNSKQTYESNPRNFDYENLRNNVLKLDCNLKDIATNIVLNDGNPNSEIMFIGEAPGAEEDKIGKPFVGQAGRLFDEMISYIGLNRRKNIYITNIIFWRPPGNRTPTSQEIATCLPLTREHIRLICPKILILMGNVAAKSLLSIKDGISKIREKNHIYTDQESKISIPVKAIFHPAYLLRNPVEKKKVWTDLKDLHKFLIKEKVTF